MRVYRTAINIAEAEHADLEVVALAALLHDVDDRKLSPMTAEKKENAARFMCSQNVSDVYKRQPKARFTWVRRWASSCVKPARASFQQ